jgi:hypothetical protein
MCTSLWGVVSVASIVTLSLFINKALSGKWFLSCLNTLTLTNSCLVIFNFLFFPVSTGNHGYTGLLLNASMNGCLIALGATCALKERQYRTFIASIFAVALSLSSVPIGVLFISLSAYFISLKRGQVKHVMPYLIFGALCIGAIANGKNLFNSAMRFDAYKIFMTEWYERGHILFGTGLGTFQAMSPQMQAKHGFMMTSDGTGHYWASMHSCWLETLFNLGVVGLILYATLFYKTLKTLFDKHEHVLFSVLSGIGATALFNYPSKYVVFGVIATCIVFRASDLKSKRARHEDFAG